MGGIILLRIILSIVVAIIADSKGRSAIGWFCFGFFISPLVAGIVIFIVGSADDDISDFQNKTESLQRQVNYNQKRNDYRSAQIENKIETLENTVHGVTAVGVNQNIKLLGLSTASTLIDEKYKDWKKIKDLKEEWVDLNCPIRLCCGEIREDIINNKSYVVLDYLNVGERIIYGVKIKLEYSKEGNIVNDDEKFFFQYINAVRLQHFGMYEPIEIRELSQGENVSVQIEKILFSDGTVWLPTETQMYKIEIKEKELKLLRKIEGEDVLRLAKLEEENWYCVCGRKNKLEDEKCQLCSRWKDYILDKYLSIEQYQVVGLDKYIEDIEHHENIDDIENSILELKALEKLEGSIIEDIQKIIERYRYMQRVYGVSSNDLNFVRQKILEILKEI